MANITYSPISMLNNQRSSLCNDIMRRERTQSLDLSVDEELEGGGGGVGDTQQERYYHSNLH